MVITALIIVGGAVGVIFMVVICCHAASRNRVHRSGKYVVDNSDIDGENTYSLAKLNIL